MPMAIPMLMVDQTDRHDPQQNMVQQPGLAAGDGAWMTWTTGCCCMFLEALYELGLFALVPMLIVWCIDKNSGGANRDYGMCISLGRTRVAAVTSLLSF